MASITLPTIAASSSSLELVRADSTIKYFGGGESIVRSTEALWVLSFDIPPGKASDTVSNRREWFAALTQLSNLENTCDIQPPGLNYSSYASTTPLVNGASQLGIELDYDAGGSNILYKGQPFEVGGEFKIATANISGASGTIDFEPALRASPSDNAQIDVLTPTITMRLAQASAPVSVLLGDFYTMKVTLVETVRG